MCDVTFSWINTKNDEICFKIRKLKLGEMCKFNKENVLIAW